MLVKVTGPGPEFCLSCIAKAWQGSRGAASDSACLPLMHRNLFRYVLHGVGVDSLFSGVKTFCIVASKPFAAVTFSMCRH